MLAAWFGVCFSPYAANPVLTLLALLLALDTCYVVLFDRCHHIGAYLPLLTGLALIALVYLQAFAPLWGQVLGVVMTVGAAKLAVLFAVQLSGVIASCKNTAAYVFVLGASAPGGKMSATMRKRADAALEILRKQPDCTAILCGGQAAGATISEAALMQAYFVERGVDKNRLLLEDASVNTTGNFRLARKKFFPGGEPQEICIVTSAYHLFRARRLAHKFGFAAGGRGVFGPVDILFNNALREAGSLVKYALLEWKILPGRKGDAG